MSQKPYLIYSDEYIAVAYKPTGMPCQADLTGDFSLIEWAQQELEEHVHLPMRLDRPTSGIVMLARDADVMRFMCDDQTAGLCHKEYACLINKGIAPAEGTLRHRLRKGQNNKTLAYSDERNNEPFVELNYKVLAESDKYSLISAQIQRGKHHQIRAQFSASGYPLRGDVKYGAKRGLSDHSIGLHAWRWTGAHPITREKIEFEAPFSTEDKLWAFFADLLTNEMK